MARTLGSGSEYIEIAPNAVFNDLIFTIAFRWRTSVGGNWEILGKHQAVTSFNGWLFAGNAASPNRMQIGSKPGSGSGWGCVDATVNASDGNWHSAVGRINRNSSGTHDLMVDGTSTAQTASGAFDPTAHVIRVGRSLDGFWADYQGDIEDIAYWNVRLTEDECKAYCKGVAPGSIRPESLRVWLPLRD